MENLTFGTDSPFMSATQPIPGYMVTCCDCGEQFFISRSNVSWYMKKDMEIPKRCPSCRERRKTDGLHQAN